MFSMWESTNQQPSKHQQPQQPNQIFLKKMAASRKQKKKTECANPFFLSLLENWRDDAKQKGLNSQWTFQKAITSLKKYPLPLRSGKDAMILENIGKLIAEKLDKALEEHLAHGGDMPLGQQETGVTLSSLGVPKPVERKRPREKVTTDQKKDTPVTHDKPNECTKAKKPKEYIPKYRSGSYALIIALHKESQNSAYKGYMTKEELQEEAAQFSEKSFTIADPGSHYTAWSSMSFLITKGYVNKCSNPAKYSITEKGTELARKLESMPADDHTKPDTPSLSLDYASLNRLPSQQKHQSSAQQFGQTSVQDQSGENKRLHAEKDLSFIASKSTGIKTGALPTNTKGYPSQPTAAPTNILQNAPKSVMDTIRDKEIIPTATLMPGTFEVVICVDHGEVAAGAKASRKKMMLEQLRKSGVNMDVRKLQLGDFLWVAREKQGFRRELVLDFIVERKRMDDLAGSIIDGRFKEQKFRLKSCGLKNIIYLVESFGSMEHMVLPAENLRQAIINSQVGDDLFVRKTESVYDSAAYLARMTRKLQSMYESKILSSVTIAELKKLKEDQDHKELMRNRTQYLLNFTDFDQLTAKNKMLTVKEMFAKQLMQLAGVSAEKAAAIVQLYPTPKRLVLAWQENDSDELKENLLANITFGRSKRKIGQMLSQQIKMLYDSHKPLL